jgi:hypothetical protein
MGNSKTPKGGIPRPNMCILALSVVCYYIITSITTRKGKNVVGYDTARVFHNFNVLRIIIRKFIIRKFYGANSDQH